MAFTNPPGLIRSETIPPPSPPAALMLDKLRAAFRAQPRVIEAFVIGEHLVPEDGRDPWDATSIILVLDPPPDTTSSSSWGADISPLMTELRKTGWERDPDRLWAFSTIEAHRRYGRPGAVQIYEKSPPSDSPRRAS